MDRVPVVGTLFQIFVGFCVGVGFAAIGMPWWLTILVVGVIVWGWRKGGE